MNDIEVAWLSWTIHHGSGATPDGHILDSWAAARGWAAAEARQSLMSPPVSDPRKAYIAAGLDALDALDAGRDDEDTVDAAFSLVGRLCGAGRYRWAWQIALPHIHRLFRLSAPDDRVRHACNLAAAAREVDGNAKSTQVLAMVEFDEPLASAPVRAAFHFARGNHLKDGGDADDAEVCYRRALQLGEASGAPVAGDAAYQLARIRIEAERDLDEVAPLLARAQALRGARSGDEQRLLLVVSEAQVSLREGRILDLLRTLVDALSALPEPPAWHEEAGVHVMWSELAAGLDHPLASEWSARLAVTAHHLGGRRRERCAVYARLGLALALRGLGDEVRQWLALAITELGSTREVLHRVGIQTSIGWAFYYFGMKQEAVEWLREAADEARAKGFLGDELAARAQLALAASGVDEALSGECAARVREFLATPTVPFEAQRARSLLVAVELLAGAPEELLRWPEALRKEKVRLDAELPLLQRWLDTTGEDGTERGRPLPQVLCWRRATAYGYLCGRGYLAFLRKHLALPPREVAAWVLSRATDAALRARIALELLAGAEGIPLETRRGADHRLAGPLRELRAMLFDRLLAESGHTNGDGRPSEPRPGAGDATGLDAFYLQWHRERPVRADEVDPDRDARPQRATAVPSEDEFAQRFMTDPESPALVQRFVSALRQAAEPDAALLADLQRVLSRHMPLTAAEYGIGPDNFLEHELFGPLRAVLATGARPILAELVQVAGQAFWITFDTERGQQGVGLHAAPIDAAEAQRRAGDLRTLLNDHNAALRHGREQAPDLVLQASRLLGTLLEPLVRAVPRGREVWMGLGAPWNTLPIERFPFDTAGGVLADRNQVMRRDPFRRWLLPPGRAPAHGDSTGALVAGAPAVQWEPAAGQLPALLGSREETARVAAALGVEPLLGTECTVARIVEALRGRRFVHLACHGFRFESPEVRALALADGPLTAPRIAALDLRGCRLVVLSACSSAQGAAFGSSDVDTIAHAFHEAGVETVLASTDEIPDAATAHAMGRLYDALLKGVPVGAAVQRAFAARHHERDGVTIWPWVVSGRSGPIIETSGAFMDAEHVES